MWGKRKQLVIATAVAGVLAASVPVWNAVAAGTASPFGQGNPLDYLQEKIDSLENQLQAALNPPTPTTLTGDYAALTTVSCAQVIPSPSPSGSELLTGSGFTQHQTLIGTIHYNGNGAGTREARSMNVNSAGTPPFGTTSSTCAIRYTVNADGTFTHTKLSGCLALGGNGVNTTIYGDVPMEGRILNGGKMLLIAGIIPAVETLVRNDGTSSQRVCTRSIVANKIN